MPHDRHHMREYTSIRRHLPYPCYIGMHNALSSPLHLPHPQPTATHAAHPTCKFAYPHRPSSFVFPPNSPSPFPSFAWLLLHNPSSLHLHVVFFISGFVEVSRSSIFEPARFASFVLPRQLPRQSNISCSASDIASCLQPYLSLSLSRWGNRGLTRIEYSTQGMQ